MPRSNVSAVYCFKKAMLTLHAIALRFSKSTPPAVPIPDTAHLPIFSDNVIPSLLVHLGVLDLSDADPALALPTLFPSARDPAVLGPLLDLAPGAAETMARRMIEQGRLKGSIDQVERLIWFDAGGDEDDAQGKAGGLGDVEQETEDTGAPFTKRWDMQIRMTAANVRCTAFPSVGSDLTCVHRSSPSCST